MYVFDELRLDERRELTGDGARHSAGPPGDLVRPELAFGGEHVENRERPARGRDALPRRLTRSRHSGSVPLYRMLLRSAQ